MRSIGTAFAIGNIPNSECENAMTEEDAHALGAGSAPASRLADVKLAHLETIVKYMARSGDSTTGAGTLEISYWVKRVHSSLTPSTSFPSSCRGRKRYSDY